MRAPRRGPASATSPHHRPWWPSRPVTLLPSLSIGARCSLPPATDGFDWLDFFAFLSSPTDSYQIPQPDSAARAEEELEARVVEELERVI
jgi:hypothetical protein